MPKIAIVGCGLIGETHAKCLAELGVPAVLFSDADHSRAEDLASRYGGKVSPDAFEAATSHSVDAVYVCTYHDTHAPLAIASARAGKHVFLEKPMALTLEECREVVRAFEESRTICMTGFKLHYYTLAEVGRSLIEAPQLLSARVSDRRWPEDSWANDPLRGGGNVLSQGCHAVEWLCSMARSRPASIYAEGGNIGHPSNAIVDSMAATIRFESGAIASLLVSDAGETPYDGKFSFVAMDGVCTVALQDRLTKLTYYDGSERKDWNGTEDGFLNESREFLAAIAEGRPAETDAADGLRATAVLLAGIRSMQTRLPISLLDIP